MRTGQSYPGDTVYFWSPTAQLVRSVMYPDPTIYYTLSWGLTILTPTIYGDYEPLNRYVMAVKIADGASAGTYTVSWTDPLDGVTTLGFDITVVEPPDPTDPDNFIELPYGATRTDIHDAIAASKKYIILPPGDIAVAEETYLPVLTPGAHPIVIDGRGHASMTRIAQPGAYKNRFFKVDYPLTLRGITFRGSQTDDLVMHSVNENTEAVNVTVENCRFEKCTLGVGYTKVEDGVGGAVIRNCEFVRPALATSPAAGS